MLPPPVAVFFLIRVAVASYRSGTRLAVVTIFVSPLPLFTCLPALLALPPTALFFRV
jgi:hypothetical protein